jgi:hypothetical protein
LRRPNTLRSGQGGTTTCPKTGKIVHATFWAAVAHLKAMRRNGLATNRMRVYRCRACSGHHIGYPSITDGDRITELLRPQGAGAAFQREPEAAH